MNPGMFFDEVLESHEFRSSDIAMPVFFRFSWKPYRGPIMQTYWTLMEKDRRGGYYK